jgi:hypothetical protein
MLALADSPDILAAMQTKTPLIFEPNSENSERLEKLCQVTNLGVTELVNVLLDWPLTPTRYPVF